MPSLDKFKFPDLLATLDKLNRDPGLGYLGIDRVHADCRWWSPYRGTPPDLLQFAWTGSDGTHFGFLTDYGTVTDLSEAPIVCEGPTGIWIVARNLYDFLCALCLLKDANRFGDFEYHLSDMNDPWWTTFAVDTNDEGYEDTLRAASIVKERVGLMEIADYRGYLKTLWAERTKKVTVETKDGLGILRTSRSSPEPDLEGERIRVFRESTS